MRGQKAPVGTIRQWAVHASSKRGHVRVRNFIKVDDRACKLLTGPDGNGGTRINRHGGWMSLARFNWIAVHGPVTADSEVIHRIPPADIPSDCRAGGPAEPYGPINVMVDDVSNLILTPKGGVNDKIRLSPASIRKHATRRRNAVIESNQQRGRIGIAMGIRAGYWYPIHEPGNGAAGSGAAGLIVMAPARTRKQLQGRLQGQSMTCESRGLKIIRGEDLLSPDGPYDGWRREIPCSPPEGEIDEIDDNFDADEITIPFPLADEWPVGHGDSCNVSHDDLEWEDAA